MVVYACTSCVILFVFSHVHLIFNEYVKRNSPENEKYKMVKFFPRTNDLIHCFSILRSNFVILETILKFIDNMIDDQGI